MEIFKANGRTYVTVPRTETKKKALSIANTYFKRSIKNLQIFDGRVEGDTLHLHKKGDVWVIANGN